MQIINIHDKSSSRKTFECGIAQASKLGSLLFLVYINDPSTIFSESKITMFADETSVINAEKRIDSLVHEDIPKITKWFELNKRNVNADKGEAIQFG